MKRKIWELFRNIFSRKEHIRKDDPSFEYIDLIQFRLDLFMAEKKPYLQPHYTIKQLSHDIKVPAYQLSAVINHQKGMNFSDYVNKLRIQYCEGLIKTEGGKNINFQKMALKCGFHNRNTFTNAFKKFTGRTPSEYLKKYW